MNLKKVWVVGKYMGGKTGKLWELGGVFSTKTKAIAACINWRYWCAPVCLDKAFPDKTIQIPAAFYPITRKRK